MSKTNAIRILEFNNIFYTAHTYDVEEEDLSGETVARKIGVAGESVFKTLVTTGDKTGINIFCIPVTAELNLKKAAGCSGNKKVEMIKTKDLFNITGYIRGGCSPIGMKKNFPTFIEETCQLFDRIYVSAGVRGMQVSISPIDLKNISGAEFADLI
ncbi:MAG: Cys-tRNA(Pro) deacylase [Ignavibacteriaceae bacterium]